MTRTALPGTPKGLAAIPGQRQVDAQTLSMIVAIASQVTVLRARLDACERVLISTGAMPPGAVDAFDPDADAQRERDAMRNDGLAKIFRALHEAGEAELSTMTNAAATETRP